MLFLNSQIRGRCPLEPLLLPERLKNTVRNVWGKFCYIVPKSFRFPPERFWPDIVQPEQEAEDRERADVRSTSGHGREDAADEADAEKHQTFPPVEVRDRVVRLPLELPGRGFYGFIHSSLFSFRF